MKHESLILSTKYHALTNVSEAKEHSTNIGFLCEEKQAIHTSTDISEAHETFYKAILQILYTDSNNVAEYEALLHGLRMAVSMGIQRLEVRGNSNLAISNKQLYDKF